MRLQPQANGSLEGGKGMTSAQRDVGNATGDDGLNRGMGGWRKKSGFRDPVSKMFSSCFRLLSAGQDG